MQRVGGRQVTVFISYRREGGFILAKYIFDYLYQAGYDVFMDVQSLGAGEFEQMTLAEISRRDYFLLVLTAGSVKEMIHENDWLRKELTQAIKTRRTVVPVLAEGLKFEDREVQEVFIQLPPSLQDLPSFNAVRIPPPEYFDSAMERLKSFLKMIAEPEPGHETNESDSASDTPEAVGQTQAALHELPLPPVTDLAGTQSATPWSDLTSHRVGRILPLPAPTLVSRSDSLVWSKVDRAERYLLEGSNNVGFKDPSEVVYEGPNTFKAHSLMFRKLRFRYYRVKAIGKDGMVESSWSNIVEPGTSGPLTQPRPPAPKLDMKILSLTWTEVRAVNRYLLEGCDDAGFGDLSEVVYEGPETRSDHFLSRKGFRYYRVKAIRNKGVDESDWSNVVRVEY